MTIKEQIAAARKAMAEISDYTQEQVDQLVYEGAKIIYHNAEPLAELAVKETGLGKVAHKIGKNKDTPITLWEHLKDKKSVGVINEYPEKGIIEIAHPAGVIGAISPTTNPTITPLVNFMQAVKGKNAIIVSPHPRSEKTTTDTVDLIREALVKCGAPADLIQVIKEPTMAKSQELMELCDLIVATGGPGLTKAAYSSGTPALGVGPGNPPVILDRGYDFDSAAGFMLEAVGYDNGILCDGANSLLYPQELEAELFEALGKKGFFVFDNEEDVDKFRKGLFPDGKINSGLIGKDATVIAEAIGFNLPDTVEVIAFKVNAVGNDEVLSKEILGPTLVLKSYDTFEEAVEMAVRNLEESGGKGHGTALFSNDQDHIMYAGVRLPVSRFLINQPSSDGWGPMTNGLVATASEGCGTWGNNIITENVDYYHQLNVTRIVSRLDVEYPDGDAMFSK